MKNLVSILIVSIFIGALLVVYFFSDTHAVNRLKGIHNSDWSPTFYEKVILNGDKFDIANGYVKRLIANGIVKKYIVTDFKDEAIIKQLQADDRIVLNVGNNPLTIFCLTKFERDVKSDYSTLKFTYDGCKEENIFYIVK